MSLGPLGIPTWQMPEGMQYAVLEGRSKKNQQVQDIFQLEYDERKELIREKIRIAPSKSTKTLLGQCGFEEKDGVFPDFQGRTVLDIGGGFGGVAPMLSTSKCDILVVDPIFSEDNIEEHYLRDINSVKSRLNITYEGEAPPSPELLRICKENAIETQKVFDELSWWEKYDPEDEHQHIKRNPSFGENIEGVTENSQDYIFVKNVLFKETVKPKEFTKEIHRVLRNGGCLILSDIFPDEEEKKQKALEILKMLYSILPYHDSNYIENSKGPYILTPNATLLIPFY